jgi:hypothetical protein
MNYLIDPQSLIFSAHRIGGFTQMITDKQIHQWDLLETAQQVSEEWTIDWPEGEGFGSSDMTYLLKDFIDRLIWRFASGRLMTKFNPSLSIVEYSEMNHHNQIQQMESGI